MHINYLSIEKKWYPVKKKKKISKIILSSKWIILQYVKIGDEYNEYIPYSILVDDNNYLEVIKNINPKTKVLIIKDNNMSFSLYKLCKKNKLKTWIYTN